MTALNIGIQDVVEELIKETQAEAQQRAVQHQQKMQVRSSAFGCPCLRPSSCTLLLLLKQS